MAEIEKVGQHSSPFRHRWEGNIRMDLQEIGINAGNWVDSAQGRDYWKTLVNVALNLRVSLAMELVNMEKK